MMTLSLCIMLHGYTTDKLTDPEILLAEVMTIRKGN